MGLIGQWSSPLTIRPSRCRFATWLNSGVRRMRAIILAGVTLVAAGCAHTPASPAAKGSLDFDSLACVSQGMAVVRFKLRNTSGKPVTFYVTSLKRPYSLFHLQVLEASSDTPWHPPSDVLERLMAPSHTITLRPGAIESFKARVDLWVQGVELRPFRLATADHSGRHYVSAPRTVCLPGSAPNNSSKPTPLRGAA